MRRFYYKALALALFLTVPTFARAQCGLGNAAFGSNFQSYAQSGVGLGGGFQSGFAQNSFASGFNPFLFAPTNSALLAGNFGAGFGGFGSSFSGGFGANFAPFGAFGGGFGGFNPFLANRFNSFGAFGGFNPFFGGGFGLGINFGNRFGGFGGFGGFNPGFRGRFAQRGFVPGAGRAVQRGRVGRR